MRPVAQLALRLTAASSQNRSGAGASPAGGGRPDRLEREYYVEVSRGLRLFVVERGPAKGYPVVILHGGGQNHECWQDVYLRLAPNLRWIIPDQRGHGMSGRPASGIYSCAAQTRDLVRMLDALRIRRCALVGHSMGGLNALRFAGTHRERASALVLVDVGTETRASGLVRMRRHPRPPGFTSLDQAVEFMGCGHRGRSKRWLLRQVHREMRRERGRGFVWKHDARIARFVGRYCADSEGRRSLLRNFGGPLLVVRGERSRILTRESASVTAAIGAGRIVEVPRSGHSVSLDQPVLLARILNSFLAPLACARA